MKKLVSLGILLLFAIPVSAAQTGDCTMGTQYCEGNTLGTTNTTTTASDVGIELGLKYCPIAPFGKGAHNPNLGNEAKHVLCITI